MQINFINPIINLSIDLTNLKKMKAIILNFETAEVLIAELPKNCEDAEQYLTDTLDLNLTNCEWMSVDELRIVNL